MNLLTIRTSRDSHPSNRGGDLVIETRSRWLRLAAYYGVPPGSHIGLWHTNCGPGEVHSWNLRIGHRYIGPCLTILIHTRPHRDTRAGRTT